jgi:predicted nicotinamide N-methyase
LNDAEQLIREYTRVAPAPLVPELQAHLAESLVPLWQATEWRAATPQPPPFWAFAWPGSLALARYLLDEPAVVASRRVVDFGAGGGLAAVAAVRAGAAQVVAYDLDPLAAIVQQLNAACNMVEFASVTGDALTRTHDADVILAGDVCYEREPSEQIVSWLREHARQGRVVLLAEPGRHYAPSAEGLELLATYDVPVLRDLESADTKRTRLWRVNSETPHSASQHSNVR